MRDDAAETLAREHTVMGRKSGKQHYVPRNRGEWIACSWIGAEARQVGVREVREREEEEKRARSAEQESGARGRGRLAVHRPLL